jgi:hypothetical protein
MVVRCWFAAEAATFKAGSHRISDRVRHIPPPRWGLSQTLECQVNGFFVLTEERGEADPRTPRTRFANVSGQL